MSGRHGVARALSLVGIGTTTLLALLVIGEVLFELQRHSPLADAALFVVSWAYLLLTPIVAVAALVLGDRRRALVRVNYAVAGLWLAIELWIVFLGYRVR